MDQPSRSEPGRGGASATEDVDATRRTYLASERTELAWWRTGLTALAVALGVGRVVPGLDQDSTHWPYQLVGIGFAVYGLTVIGYGSIRRGAVERALAAGRFPSPSRFAHGALAVGGVALGLLTALLIVLD